ncbi:AMP-dependent synthetase/ligase [Demequina flava]|uniref:AMP-dependent synthetase/ligase n=1 Tax=Demequina flava TaxID=1095025 RepID=UPI001364B843|nr:long-chain fatty acid--CoA ligase [Demequina flava]
MTSPPLVTLDPSLHLTAVLNERASSNPSAAFAEVKDEQGEWTGVTIGEFRDRVRAIAKGLIATGVSVGDRVGVMGDTRIEWSELDYAILAAGGVTVPIYPSSSASQCAWIVEDAGISFVGVESDENQAMLAALEGAPEVLPLTAAGLDELAARGASVSDEDLAARTADVTLVDLATIIYTSGTTGRPKGAMLTHRNLVEHAANVEADPNFGTFVHGETRVLLFLPLAHVFARFAMILALQTGSVIGYTPNHKSLAADLQAFKPTWMPLVPRVLETVYNRADTSMKGIRKTLFRWSAKVAREMSASMETGGPSSGLNFRYKLADRLVLSKIRALLGGNLQYVLAGGAKLTPSFGHFFRGLGITVMQGYGLTETSAAVVGTPVTGSIMGTVGRPIAGCEAKVDDDGEILVRGIGTFPGYWNAPDATAQVMRDGWFATGDLGEIKDGSISITGRKKELLVLSSGKNIQPAMLEDFIRSHPAIQDSVVIGDGRHFVSAVVTLDPVLLPDWLAAHDLPEMDLETASMNEKVREAVGRAVASANEQVSKAEAIKEFRILPREFSETREEITASLKVRRTVVMEHFSDVIESIYAKKPGKNKPPRSAA